MTIVRMVPMAMIEKVFDSLKPLTLGCAETIVVSMDSPIPAHDELDTAE